MNETEKPGLALLVKLASIAVHVEEMLSPSGHYFDRGALQGLLDDSEVRIWLAEMGKKGFLPVKR